MKYTLILIALLSASVAYATPPRNVSASYNGTKLHIEADHPSDRLERHYIRRVVVTKNGNSTESFYFPRQRASNAFVEDLEYTANDGDHLDIELNCSQGGSGRTTLDVGLTTERKDSNDEKTVQSRR